MGKNAFIVLILAAIVTVSLIALITQTDPASTDEGPAVAGDGADGATSPPSPAPGPSAPLAPGEVMVTMASLRYSPVQLTVAPGTTVTWVNEDPIAHTVTPTDKDLWGTEGSGDATADWMDEGDTWSFTFDEPGTYTYYCIPHASQADDGSWRGMVATVTVTEDGAPAGAADGGAFVLPTETVVPDPVAPPLMEPDPDGIVRIRLETIEKVAQLGDESAYEFWTFGGTVPGPMLRVREGHTVELTLANPADSAHPHNIDLHAVTGPGGGAAVTLAQPGEERTFRFKALNPGLFVYHCAAGHVPSHIANGMFGMILVEPKEGLPAVDREYYVVQGEVYTEERVGATGMLSYSLPKLMDEDPEYFLFNGRLGSLTGDGALTAEVGETVRLYFGVGGAIPSSFHVIGEVFDRVYMDGNGAVTTNRQTVLVPAAGAAMIEFMVDYPGTYVLVDHTLTRAFDRGAAGLLIVTGEEDSSIYEGEGAGEA